MPLKFEAKKCIDSLISINSSSFAAFPLFIALSYSSQTRTIYCCQRIYTLRSLLFVTVNSALLGRFFTAGVLDGIIVTDAHDDMMKTECPTLMHHSHECC